MSTESEFLQQVKDSLGHLYDYPYLENHPLALRYWPEPEHSGPHRAQRLSRLLLESIEALHPPDTSAKGASRTEYYLLLVYRYVEEWPLPNIMRELGYSRRQFFRQQQKAIEMLAGSLWERAPQPKPVKLDTVLDDELERFRTRHRAVDIQEVVQGVLEMVGQLAEQHQVILSCDLPAGMPVSREKAARRSGLRPTQAANAIFGDWLAAFASTLPQAPTPISAVRRRAITRPPCR